MSINVCFVKLLLNNVEDFAKSIIEKAVITDDRV